MHTSYNHYRFLNISQRIMLGGRYVVLLSLCLISPESKAGALGSIMKWVGNEIFELALDEVEGAALDAARDMVTRPGTLTVEVDDLKFDAALAAQRVYYRDDLASAEYTIQPNHLQGALIIGGGGAGGLLERNFRAYDWLITQDGETSHHFGQDWAGFNEFEPKQEAVYRDFGWLQQWECKHVLTTKLSNTGKEDLKLPYPGVPDHFTIHIQYKLADLVYEGWGQIKSTERDKPSYKQESVKATMPTTVTNLDLVKKDSEIIQGPIALGKCTRRWELKFDTFDLSKVSLDGTGLVDELRRIFVDDSEWTVRQEMDAGLF